MLGRLQDGVGSLCFLDSLSLRLQPPSKMYISHAHASNLTSRSHSVHKSVVASSVRHSSQEKRLYFNCPNNFGAAHCDTQCVNSKTTTFISRHVLLRSHSPPSFLPPTENPSHHFSRRGRGGTDEKLTLLNTILLGSQLLPLLLIRLLPLLHAERTTVVFVLGVGASGSFRAVYIPRQPIPLLPLQPRLPLVSHDHIVDSSSPRGHQLPHSSPCAMVTTTKAFKHLA